MKHKNLEQWSPCRGYCQMAGAASVFLSIKDGCVLMNSPRWCAVLAERELAAAIKDFENRLFCSEIDEKALLYGAEEKLLQAAGEIRDRHTPSFLGLLTSCSLSLIGDEVSGICQQAQLGVPLLSVEAGGLRGEFWRGYSEAMLALLRAMTFMPVKERQAGTVNLIGISACYPNWQGDIAELKRLLSLVGIKVGLCLGENGQTLSGIEEALPRAALNVVVARELGEDLAVWLQEQLGQDYILAGLPYGPTQTLAWLEEIGAALAMPLCLDGVREEIKVRQSDIHEEYIALKDLSVNMQIKRLLISAPYSIACGLARGMEQDFKEIREIYTRVQGPCFEKSRQPVLSAELLDDLYEDSYQLLCGTENDRHEFGGLDKTVYLNFFMPASRIKVPWETFAGLTGWSYLLKSIFTQLHTLLYR